MTDHTGQRDVNERDLIGPELVPRLRRDDSQLMELYPDALPAGLTS